MAEEAIRCPFCGFTGDGGYAIQLHIEEHHTEDSPFIVNDVSPTSNLKAPALPPRPATASASSSSSRPPSDENPWVKCTRPGCGEYVNVRDIQEHLDLHEAASISEDGEKKSLGRRTPQDSDRALKRKDRSEDAISSSNGRSYQTERRSPEPSQRSVIQEGRRTPPSNTDVATTGSSRDPQRSVLSSKSLSVNNSPQKTQRNRQPGSNNSSHSSQWGIVKYFAGTSQKGPVYRRDNQSGQTPRQYLQRRLRPPLHPGRLGKRELGPHAFEDTMPDNVRKRLLNDAVPYQRNRIDWNGRMYQERVVDNETAGLVPTLSDICAEDQDTVRTYFCHPSVRHVNKINCDGNFCGYWNIQMLLSYVHDQDARKDGGQVKDLPNVLQISNVIEQAWDRGICSYGRIETGGVKNSRKWIGTHEALAFFTRINVEVEALSFKTEAQASPPTSESGSSSSSAPGTTHLAVSQLLDHVEAYFISGLEKSRQYRTSITTSMPPIYFQRFGHSMTIVGLERKANGTRNLLVFDPSFATSAAMDRCLAKRKVSATVDQLLRPYRRSELALSRWDEFEVIAPKMTEEQREQTKRPSSAG